MEKRTLKKAVFAVTALALLSTTLMTTSTAKYISSFMMEEAKMNVAKWDIDVNPDGTTTTLEGSTLSVSPSVDRQTTEELVFEEKFDGTVNANAMYSEFKWSLPKNIDGAGTWVNNGPHKNDSLLTYVKDPADKEGTSAKFPAFDSDQYSLFTLADKDVMQDAEAYSISMRIKMTDTALGKTGDTFNAAKDESIHAPLVNILFGADREADYLWYRATEYADADKTIITKQGYADRNFFRLSLRTTSNQGWNRPDNDNKNSTNIDERKETPTDIGYQLSQEIDEKIINTFYYVNDSGTTSTNAVNRVIGAKVQEWFDIRIEVDNIKETVSVYINGTLDFVYENKNSEEYIDTNAQRPVLVKNEAKMSLVSGPIMLWSQYGENYIDDVKIVKRVSRPVTTVYEEDFTGKPTFEQAGWIKPTSMTATLTHTDIAYTNGDAGIAANISPAGDTMEYGAIVDTYKLKGANQYSLDMRIKLQNLTSTAGITASSNSSFNVVFSDMAGRNAADMNKDDYMYLSFTTCDGSPEGDIVKKMTVQQSLANGAKPCIGVTIVHKIGNTYYNALGSGNYHRLYKEGKTNDPLKPFTDKAFGQFFNLRLEVDNEKGKIRVCSDDKLLISYDDATTENNISMTKTSGPIMLEVQRCNVAVDDIKIDAQFDLLPIYNEDFNSLTGGSTVSAGEVGWTNIMGGTLPTLKASTGKLELGNTSGTKKVMLLDTDQLDGADKYSIEMDLDIDVVNNNSGAEFDICFGDELGRSASEITNTNYNYAYFSFRPAYKKSATEYDRATQTEGKYATAWAIIMARTYYDGSAKYPGMSKHMKIGDDFAAQGDIPAIQYHLKLEVDNVNKTIVAHLYDAQGTETVFEYSDATSTFTNANSKMPAFNGPLFLNLQNTKATVDNISIKRSYTNISSETANKIAPGMGGKLVDVTLTNSGKVNAEFEMKMKIAEAGTLPENFAIVNGDTSLGVSVTIEETLENGKTVFYVTFRGRLNYTEGENTAKCMLNWQWPYIEEKDHVNGGTESIVPSGESSSQDAIDGAAAGGNSDIVASIEYLTISQVLPGIN